MKEIQDNKSLNDEIELRCKNCKTGCNGDDDFVDKCQWVYVYERFQELQKQLQESKEAHEFTANIHNDLIVKYDLLEKQLQEKDDKIKELEKT
jgi:hypothetical protein